MSDSETSRVTYVELARARGITVAAARRLTQRHKWPKQIGNDGFTHVIVPTSILTAWDGDKYDDSGANSIDAYDDVSDDRKADVYVDAYDDAARSKNSAVNPATVRAIADATADAWADLWDDATADTRRAIRALEETVASLREQLATERLRRAEDKERVDRAEQQARGAEDRIKELQEKLEAEMIEHRRLVSLLTERIPSRRSWWPWRRR